MRLPPGFHKATEIEAITTEDMRAIEINATHLGTPLTLLMENAGNAIASFLEWYLGGAGGLRVQILSGKGGNGGDGLSAARRLANRGAEVTVHLTHKPPEITHPSTLDMYRLLVESEVKIYTPGDEEWLALDDADALVDAVLGVGVKGGLRGNVRRSVEAYNSASGLRVSVDVPTGLDPDSGYAAEGTARSDYTITMHKPKPGLMTGKARVYSGEVLVAEIGIPRNAEVYAGPGDVYARIPDKPRDAHKGTGGKVLIVGGSNEYVGAPVFSSLAAYAAGADLVFLAAPFSREASLRYPEIVPRGLETVEDLVPRVHSIVVGPGLGEREDLLLRVIEAAKRNNKATVIDADGLKILARSKSISLNENFVLTPHRGEAKLLLGLRELPRVVEAAKRIASRYNATALIKAPEDAVCSPSGYCRLNREGAPEMSVGGTGDVLAGVIGAFLARRKALGLKLDALNTAAAALYVVGKAGSQAVSKTGLALPSMIINEIPQVIASSKKLPA
ncbi:MAG: NAD(P)H-hydrate dehydratase [Aeropyrum sp.]|nr:NAD(P)H-hydrate dehydratase [Aeropyrum sp.]